MDVSVEFRKVIPITKAWEGDDGELYIEGESSGPEFDLDRQFMTPECVKDMSDQVNTSPIPVNDEHQRRGILNDLGVAVRSEVTPEVHMRPTVRLDKDNPAAVTLHKKIQKGKQFGFSIAGRVLEPVKKMVGDMLFKGFNKIKLDHIAVTTKPSWSPSLGTLVAKSLEADGFDWNDAPDYEGEFFAVVEKRSKPDPKAGKGYMLVEELLRRLNTIFGWESYQERIAEDNRDVIPLQDHEVVQQLWPPAIVPVQAPTKAFDPEGEEDIGYIQKAVDMAEPAKQMAISDLKQMADIYNTLYWMYTSLQERDRADGNKDNKKTVTKLKSAMAAISDAMQQVLAKKSAPQPLVYGQENVQQPDEEGSMENVIKDFSQVEQSDVGQPPAVQKPAEPSVGEQLGQKLTNFAQVAEAGQVEKPVGEQPAEPEVVKVPEAVEELADGFGEFIKKVFASEGTPAEKQATLMQGGQAFYGKLGQMLEAERPEADRLQEVVQKAVAPLVQKIESLEVQLAAAKTQRPAESGDEPELVRKSLVIGVEPSRVVKQFSEAPTFENLVRWPYGGGAAPDFPEG